MVTLACSSQAQLCRCPSLHVKPSAGLPSCDVWAEAAPACATPHSRWGQLTQLVMCVLNCQQVGETEDRLLPLLPKLQRESFNASNGEAGPSSPAQGSGQWQAVAGMG